LGRQIFYATLVSDPPINHLAESPLRRFFQQQGGNARLYAHGQNIPSLLEVSSIPVYLGLGPEIYESPELRVDFSKTDRDSVSEAVERLLRFGVTHLLLEAPISADTWPVKSLGAWTDPFLNRSLARLEPYYLYELLDSRGRAFFDGPETPDVRGIKTSANRVQIEVPRDVAGRLVLRDLAYPGWRVDGESRIYDGLFRSVEVSSSGEPRTIAWVYRPSSVYWGAGFSGLGLLGTLGLVLALRRRA
jgi:hypothetical protein